MMAQAPKFVNRVLFQENGTPPSRDLEEQSSTSTAVDKIQSWRHVYKAFALSWSTQQRHLFTSWIHVPVGVTALLVVSWALRLAINQAPFRFPAPVLVMLALFAILLLLDWLSLRFPSQEQETTADGTPQRKRFLSPVMAVLAPPCEFCLRNMSVMFTPSFVLIPAREMIPSKEIGLLAAWFAITQVLGYVFPVLMAWGVGWTYTKVRYLRRPAADEDPSDTVQPTLPGLDFEKGVSFQGGRQLSTIATGLSGVTATIVAPVSHVRMHLTDDERRHIESSAMEFARQQGDPAVTCNRHGVSGRHHRLRYDGLAPRSDVSSYEHHVHAHHRRHGRPRIPRSVSAGRVPQRHLRARSTSPRAGMPRPPERAHTTMVLVNARGGHHSADAPLHRSAASLQEYSMDSDLPLRGRRRSSTRSSGDAIEVCEPNCRGRQTLSAIPSADVTAVNSRRGSVYDVNTQSPRDFDLAKLPSVIRRGQHSSRDAVALPPSVPARHYTGDLTIVQSVNSREADAHEVQNGKTHSDDDDEDTSSDGDSDDDDDNDSEDDAIADLSSWINDLITPSIYGVLFIVGIPLFFARDIALPLFLAVNILTFVASITIVPPKIRRFAHPILTTSISTVLIIWAFAAMKGIGLKDCLNRFYSVGAKYTKLWAPSGYNGPVPGAGDVLFSTLDAGIVALAVPMYRYRRELRETFVRMCIVLVPCAALSLFFWNWIARLMGMDQIRALAFSARFMSTPLAIELAGNVGADESITVILVVITGVVAAILKEQFFYRLMRVKKDDYLTVGLAMGATSGAIGANSLISTPRTMAIASLSFVIFGTILLVATAIPTIVDVVRSLAG